MNRTIKRRLQDLELGTPAPGFFFSRSAERNPERERDTKCRLPGEEGGREEEREEGREDGTCHAW